MSLFINRLSSTSQARAPAFHDDVLFRFCKMAASDADKLRVAAHFMMSAPPAQLDELTRDVRTLLAPVALTDETAEAIYSQYNGAHLVCVRTDADGAGDSVMVLSNEGRVDATHYIDSSACVVRGVNNRALAVTDEPAVDARPRMCAELEPYRAALLKALKTHVATLYNPMGVGSQPWSRGAEVYSSAGDASALVCVASVCIRNLPNFWSGAWNMRCKITFPSGVAAGTASVSGSITIATHYFEAANTQMHDDKKFGPVSIAFSDADTFARASLSALSASEERLAEALAAMYEALAGTSLKEMRRALPVAGQKMNWNIAEHRMRKTLTSTSGAAAAK